MWRNIEINRVDPFDRATPRATWKAATPRLRTLHRSKQLSNRLIHVVACPVVDMFFPTAAIPKFCPRDCATAHCSARAFSGIIDSITNLSKSMASILSHAVCWPSRVSSGPINK
jgi:hypothetical protein